MIRLYNSLDGSPVKLRLSDFSMFITGNTTGVFVLWWLQWTRTLEVNCTMAPCCSLKDVNASYWHHVEEPSLCQHRHFISLHQPFMGKRNAVLKRRSPACHSTPAS